MDNSRLSACVYETIVAPVDMVLIRGSTAVERVSRAAAVLSGSAG
ncbi:hypothetical protein A8926_4042 [Saccharopolyspora spinosa]|uniref:Uncharacterized protein n=1 Tax=Saccharopolyspora spinosa TaxID=60894 RepID=A0A2N3Y012_SACSN|nr:hypothetical protein A8926_4042 [Saccharopolyspora spinosa]